jgi:hypothetical protein
MCKDETELIAMLERSGIKRRSRRLSDYERAKRMLPDMSADEYESAIRMIVEYVGV